ncbi:MAG: adenosylcobinamide-GDP ribazoletransferase [Candidatus Bathyarchaeota archaeon]|jgi:adenosylcobinamide-GDP ribazoletransferase|nr:adenosylcobinamide-GDP ribazoletransferase [Candidatus Bathyarchaeota archaeon A05DMB-3]MDH7607005.1 adenosylcobinamide-GDP ribazoletransferase [Candidatus Bathyarchaeota archaeon]
MKALKIFKDLVAFLTIIPLTKDESFAETSARYMFLFPVVGGVIGLFTAVYFQLCIALFSLISPILKTLLGSLEGLFVKVFSSGATLSFLLVLTGLQHFDGLVDLGNAFGFKSLEERRFAAHAWIVTYKGAFLAVLVEFLAFMGIFLLDVEVVFRALICAEVSAKLAMVSLTLVGKPAYGGLGALFVQLNRGNKLVALSYIISFLILFPLFGFSCLLFLLVSFLAGFFMEKLSERVFGGASGDTLGATNEIVRAICLLLIASGVVP